MANEVLNTWGKIKIVCLEHEKLTPMEIVQTYKTPFFGCEKYAEGKEDGCPNRVNIDDYEGLVLKFLELIGDEEAGTCDFTNCTFEYKKARQKIFVKVLKYSHDEIILGVRNTTIIRR